MRMVRSVTILIGISLILVGCSVIRVQNSRTGSQDGPAGGLFFTQNGGDVWALRNDLYAVGTPKKIQYSSVTFLKFDPSEPQTLYLGTNNGIYYTSNDGEGWFQTKPGSGVANDLAIDPNNACILYAAVHDKIYKSEDCARSWTLIHFSSLKGQFFTSLYVSPADSRTVLLGASNGSLIISRNSGVSWEVVRYLDTPIIRFVPHPKDPAALYIVSQKFGIQVTRDSATTLTSLNELPVRKADGTEFQGKGDKTAQLKELSQSSTFYDLKFDESQQNGLIYASGYGIFRLINEEYWQEIEILNKPRQAKIYSVALDGLDGSALYFATNGAFYRSDNSGKEWTVKQLPASGVPQFLAISPEKRGQLFISIVAPPPK